MMSSDGKCTNVIITIQHNFSCGSSSNVFQCTIHWLRETFRASGYEENYQLIQTLESHFRFNFLYPRSIVFYFTEKKS